MIQSRLCSKLLLLFSILPFSSSRSPFHHSANAPPFRRQIIFSQSSCLASVHSLDHFWIETPFGKPVLPKVPKRQRFREDLEGQPSPWRNYIGTYVTNSHTLSCFCRSISVVAIQRERQTEGARDEAHEADCCDSHRRCGHGYGMVATPQDASGRLADTAIVATSLTYPFSG